MLNTLKFIASLKWVQKHIFSYLPYYVRENNMEKTVKCLKNGYDPNNKNRNGQHALHYACMNKNIEIVELLIKSNCDINVKNKKGITPLMIAHEKSYKKIEKILIKSLFEIEILNSDPNFDYVDYISSIFKPPSTNTHCDSYSDNLEKLKKELNILIESGYNMNIKNKYMKTLLHNSCSIQNDSFSMLNDNYSSYLKMKEEVVRILIYAKADLNIKDKEGKTPLHIACNLYFAFSKDPNAYSTYLKTKKEIVRILIDEKCDSKIKDEKGKTALDTVNSFYRSYKSNLEKSGDITTINEILKILQDHIKNL